MPNLPTIDPNAAPEQLLGDILTYVEQAGDAVTARDMPTLAGMDTVVDALCQRVLALDPSVSREYAVELEHLMQRIEQLQNKMAALQGEVRTTLKSLTNTKKANQAYKNAPEG